MKNNTKLGAVLSILGILAGLLTFYLLAWQYNLVIDAKTSVGRLDEATSVTIVYAVLGWLGIAAGGIWAAVLYGFIRQEGWAWFWGTLAASLQLLAGFFPAVPAMDSHLPGPTLIVFGIAAVLWFGMLLIKGVGGKIITLTFFVGIAYVLTFMDGVAPISKYTTSHDNPFWNGMYVMSQQVSWWGAAAWLVFLMAVLNKKTWALPVGIFGASMSMMAGYPLGLHNAFFEVHRFSMFLPAPLLSTILLVIILLPGTQKMFADWNQAA